MTRRAASLIRSLKRDKSGSIAVEFALVAPVLVFVLAGVIDIGSATYARLSLDARVTAAAEYALFQTAPNDQDSADDLARKLIGLLQGEASDTAEVIVNNAASARWTGSAVTTSSRPGDAAACYCPTLVEGDLAWGPVAECGTPCTDGGSAGQFVQLSATTRHVTIFPGYAFIDGDTVATRTVLRLQ
ncbi:TadE/TadG family type IV pilus assembly protein [Roseovarius nitratireducens]|uniref:TadE/TadG family type IV pilus assembly protein n=1 Tax=Roseovarius nitratireducens TaxID=2044597 RepID=UPI0013EC2BFB|nr:TadE/TadG family type IV pilus assembly protein [Roseovarius nitratireducens]